MSMPRALAGRARGTIRNRVFLFEDPTWEDRFDCLIRLTQRTSLIQELTGTDIRATRLKEQIDRRLLESGEKPDRPRGLGRSFQSEGFLATKFERFDASYLIALHFGPRGHGEFSESEDNLGRALDKRMEAYGRYKAELYPGAPEARLSFETYCVLVKGIRAKTIEVHTCKDCGSRHPWHSKQLALPVCPVCAVLDLRMKEARRAMDLRIQRKRASRHEVGACRLEA